MLTSFSSNAITAKARAIYGRRLTNSNYTELLRLRTVADVATYLKTNTNYSQYLKGINEMQIHRGQLENLLNRSRFEKYFSLCHYDFTKDKGFYRYVISNAEISVILRAIMLLNSGSPQDIIVNIPSFMQEYACFDFMELSKIKCFDDLLTVLEHTQYKNVIKRFAAPNGNINLTDCELALKTHYYKMIFALIDKYYKGKTKKELYEIVLIEIELLNLSLIYRLKRYFKKPPEEIKLHILPFYYKLNQRSIDALLDGQHRQQFIEGMKLHVYNSNMKNVEFNYIEDYTKRLKYIINRKLMRFSTNAPISFYALMSLIQIEIENTIIIIEGIRYQDSPSEIQKLLILE
ncbi:MAG: V-type ATPase subunit [Oscillospiraceae bacterium]